MIYLASPYSHPECNVRIQRFVDVCRYAATLMAGGELVYSPIAHTHPIADVGELPTDWTYWEKLDTWFIERCDKVVVLMLNGWHESKGIKAEIEIAERLGKPIVYVL